MVEIHISNVRSQIHGTVPRKTLKNLEDELSYELPGARFMKRYNPWAGRNRLFNKFAHTFPTGLLHRVRKILREDKISFTIVDKRIAPILGHKLPIKGFKLREYQQNAVSEAIKRQRGIIKVGTGGGKTNILTGIISNLNIPTLVLIHKTDIFHQLHKRLEDALGVPVGRIGDGHCELQRITVCMVQTIAYVYGQGKKSNKKKVKRKKVDLDDEIEEGIDYSAMSKADKIFHAVENAECIITDEAHHCPADSFWNVHKKARNAYYKIGMSATPWRDDNADLLIEAANAQKIVDISASTLMEWGYLCDAKIYYHEFKHDIRLREDGYHDVYDEDIVNNMDRNKEIVQIAVEAAAENKTVLIAIRKVDHGRILEGMLKEIEPQTTFAYGDVNSEERQGVLRDLNDRKLKIVICTTVFGEGIDIPNLDVLINAKAAKSSVDSFQLIGRALRKTDTKDKAYIVDIADQNCKYMGAHAKARLKIYKTEPRYRIIKTKKLSDISFNDKEW